MESLVEGAVAAVVHALAADISMVTNLNINLKRIPH